MGAIAWYRSHCLTVIISCAFTRSGNSFLDKNHCIFLADPCVEAIRPLHFEGMRTSMIHILWINTHTRTLLCAPSHSDILAPGRPSARQRLRLPEHA